MKFRVFHVLGKICNHLITLQKRQSAPTSYISADVIRKASKFCAASPKGASCANSRSTGQITQSDFRHMGTSLKVVSIIHTDSKQVHE